MRLIQGSKPDVVLIQEFNYGDGSATAIQKMVDATLPGFYWCRESGGQIPNGVLSRWPILGCGEWTDPQVGNRDFVWARIDIPGPRDLWAISLHLLTSSAADRNAEATSLVQSVQATVPAGDYLVLGGDLNADTLTEACVGTLAKIVVTSGPQPVDQSNNGNTNAARAKPYDRVYADPDLKPLQTATVIGSSTYPDGLVLDSRIYTPLSDVAPVQKGDSAASNMQHMGVMKDFLVSY